MSGAWVGFLSALWLGIMTSISPCALATNVATISFLAKKINHPSLVLVSGIAYTAGRTASYAALGFALIHSVLSIPQAAQFLQKYMMQALGPILIITGLVVLEVVKMRLPGLSLSEKHHYKLAQAGFTGAFLLGAVFALAFCPVSAALFFGSLIPLALNHKLGAMLPFVYGIGTGLPVLLFAVMISVGVSSLSRWFHKLTRLEYYMRIATGAIFVLAGLYYSGTYLAKFFLAPH